MKLTVKTLKGTNFGIIVQPTSTVMAVKKNIEDLQGKDNYPCGLQLLVHNGKVLKDETTLAENKVTEEGFVVVMLGKSKLSSSSGTSSHQPTSSSASSLELTSEGQSLTPESSTLPASNATSINVKQDTYVQAASNLVGNNDLEQTIRHIMDIGGGNWDKETVTSALRAAYSNPERAIDYLYLGIPKSAEVVVPVTNFTLSMVKEAFPAQEEEEEAAAGGPNAEVVVPETLSGGNSGELSFLRNNLQFLALRSMVQENPKILQPMLQELGKQNPQLLRLIQEHITEFLELLNEPGDGSQGEIFDQPDQDMPHAINVTPIEQEVVQRLEGMGFGRARVIEAFLACDRNEELAANYLLENAGDSEE